MTNFKMIVRSWGFPGGSAGKESACNAGDLTLIPGLGRSPGEGKGYPLQYSGLENSMSTVHGVAKSWTRLTDFHSHMESSGQKLTVWFLHVAHSLHLYTYETRFYKLLPTESCGETAYGHKSALSPGCQPLK